MPDQTRADRESVAFDVVIVGAGPAGLAAAIRLRQLAQKDRRELSVCVLEKGSEVGAHILSGAVIELRALNELIPDWSNRGAPIHTPANDDRFLFLTRNRAWRMPTPPQMNNTGNYIVSLGNVCRWLARQAEELGVEIFPAFGASEVLYDADNAVKGVATSDMGITRTGEKGPTFEPGVELHARQTLFTEGCRGSLTKELFRHYGLERDADPQTYAIGIKELWEISPEQHKPGKVIHSVGWPLDRATYGGAFLYHLEDLQVAVGVVVGLDYANPYLNPFEEMQRFKLHPAIRPVFRDGKRVVYGSRALVEGGYQSLPKLTFPGGILAGDCAGFMNVPKIKGTHTAMKSGMLAAESVFEALEREQVEAVSYDDRLKRSWVLDELHKVRNIRPGFAKWGLLGGIAYAGLDTYILRGRAPWTFPNHADHEQLKPADQSPRIDYPKPDGKLTFDLTSSVFISNTNHREDQPCHLQLADDRIPVEYNLAVYDGPEQRYCPAGVYEFVRDKDAPNLHLQINAQNCVHCKTCDIKDPKQNINWVVPEGGGGPNYPNM